jgi:hypothetical protein
LKPNDSRARAALLLIWIMFGLEVLSLISSWMQFNLLQDMVAGVYVSESDIAWNDMREQLLGVIYLAGIIVSAITFIRWFRRAYKNLERTGYRLTYREGWATGAWFVPFLNWVRPYQIMRELYEGSRLVIPQMEAKQALSKGRKNLPFWWLFWLANNILGQVIFNLSRGPQNLDRLQSITTLSLISNFVGLVLCLITVVIIREYSRVEHLLVPKADPYFEDSLIPVDEVFSTGATGEPLKGLY